MRIASFSANDRDSFGLVTDGGIVDCGARLGATTDLRSCLQHGALDRLDEWASAAPDFALDDVRFLPVIASPAARFFCVGINYRPHMREVGREVPQYPVIFVRFPVSIVGHGETVTLPRATEKFDYEGELAVVIGRRGRHVSPESALDFVAGYSCFFDGSARDFQRHSGTFTAGKNFDRSGAFGPWLVTSDVITDPATLQLETRLNGQVVQSESTGELHFSIPQLIAYISTWTALEPGDVIATGTPGGVGAGRTPPLWLKAGDSVEVEISAIGCLSNGIVAEDA